MLLVLTLATLLTPVPYRAGAEEGHAHTIFQGVIDAITGQPHDHSSDEHHDDAVQGSHAPDQAVFAEPDAPRLLGLSMPISSLAAIETLGLLVAALLAGVAARPVWATVRRLLDWAFALDPPPPRCV